MRPPCPLCFKSLDINGDKDIAELEWVITLLVDGKEVVHDEAHLDCVIAAMNDIEKQVEALCE